MKESVSVVAIAQILEEAIRHTKEKQKELERLLSELQRDTLCEK